MTLVLAFLLGVFVALAACNWYIAHNHPNLLCLLGQHDWHSYFEGTDFTKWCVNCGKIKERRKS